MRHGRTGTRVEEENLVVGACRELVDDLLIFVHSNKAGLRERSRWRSAGKVTGLAPLWREKQGSHFFHQENKNTDNAQDDGNPAQRNNDLSKPIEDAAPRYTG